MKDKAAYILSDFCKVYSCSRSEAYREIRRGNLKAVKRGRNTIITAEAAEAWLKSLPALPSAA
jgi:hypothetical protein